MYRPRFCAGLARNGWQARKAPTTFIRRVCEVFGVLVSTPAERFAARATADVCLVCDVSYAMVFDVVLDAADGCGGQALGLLAYQGS